MFGGDYVTIVLEGDTFDDAFYLATEQCEELNKTFVHPFDDEKVIEGQATVGLEIIEQSNESIDYVFVPVGGGGLASVYQLFLTRIIHGFRYEKSKCYYIW